MNREKLQIKRLRKETQLPKYETELASGFDVRAYACELWINGQLIEVPISKRFDNGELAWIVPKNSTVIFKTGLAVACPKNTEVQARARSGYSLKTPMRISNGIGTIDEDYRGEVGIIMDNISDKPFFVSYGERVAQLVVAPVIRVEIEDVQELDTTERGEGGYGSTGTK